MCVKEREKEKRKRDVREKRKVLFFFKTFEQKGTSDFVGSDTLKQG